MTLQIHDFTPSAAYTLTGTFATLEKPNAKVPDQDEAVLHLFWTPAEVGAKLHLRVKVSADDTAANFVYVTIKTDAPPLSTLQKKEYIFDEVDGDAVVHAFEVPLPIVENILQIEVMETATLAGELTAKCLSNILGKI